MNKSEIIEKVAYANVPSGAMLIEHSHPEYGITISRLSEHHTGGLQLVVIAKIAIAKIFTTALCEETQSLPERPTADLFSAIHASLLATHLLQIKRATREIFEKETRAVHQKMIACLQAIAAQEGIAYEAPDDPLLKKE